MKVKLLLVILTALLILFSVIGCLEDELNAAESLAKAISAIDEVTSYSYDATSQLDYILPNHFSITTNYNASVKMVKEPYTAEIDLAIDMSGEEMAIQMYLVNDTYYFNAAETGWMRQDTDKIQLLPEANLSPFKMIEILHVTEPGSIKIDNGGGDLVLSYVDQDGVFAKHIQKEFLEELLQEMVNTDNGENFIEELTFESVFYELTIDGSNYLPEKEVIHYHLLIDFMGEEMIIYNKTVITYHEYDTFKSISVPEEVIDEAILYE